MFNTSFKLTKSVANRIKFTKSWALVSMIGSCRNLQWNM